MSGIKARGRRKQRGVGTQVLGVYDWVPERRLIGGKEYIFWRSYHDKEEAQIDGDAIRPLGITSYRVIPYRLCGLPVTQWDLYTLTVDVEQLPSGNKVAA